MNTAFEYIFDKKSITFDVVLTALFDFMMLGMSIYIAVKGSPFYLVLFFFALPAIFSFFQYYLCKVTLQYNRYDDGKRIIISADRLNMTLGYGDNKISIDSQEIEKVELYEQYNLGKFGRFEYLVLYTTKGLEILITNFTIPGLLRDKALEKYLRQKPRTYFKKTFNYIDEDKFKL